MFYLCNIYISHENTKLLEKVDIDILDHVAKSLKTLIVYFKNTLRLGNGYVIQTLSSVSRVLRSVSTHVSSIAKCFISLGATARSYRRQDGADAAARFEKFLPAHASLRPPISLKFTTEKHGGMVHLVSKRHTRTFSRFCTIIPKRFAARRR